MTITKNTFTLKKNTSLHSEPVNHVFAFLKRTNLTQKSLYMMNILKLARFLSGPPEMTNDPGLTKRLRYPVMADEELVL